MAKWTAFPHDNADYSYDTAALKKNWARLHAGDAEPLPKDDKGLINVQMKEALGKIAFLPFRPRSMAHSPRD